MKCVKDDRHTSAVDRSRELRNACDVGDIARELKKKKFVFFCSKLVEFLFSRLKHVTYY